MEARRPNACNLCHLDKTLQWSAEKLSDWYELPLPDLTSEQSEIAASVVWLLKGDAGERALAASSMGWDAAQHASGTDWLTPLLARLLMDPYQAVRVITRRSIRTLPAFQDLDFDIMASESMREEIMANVLRKWQTLDPAERKQNPATLMGANGVQWLRVNALMKERDDTEVRLME